MAVQSREKVDYRLLNMLSDLVICSACLRVGKVTPVPQLITSNREITNICSHCRSARAKPGVRAKFGKLLRFRRT